MTLSGNFKNTTYWRQSSVGGTAVCYLINTTMDYMPVYLIKIKTKTKRGRMPKNSNSNCF